MPKFDAMGIVVEDMAKALAFYRLLGLSIPADLDAERHAEVELSGGFRLMFDTAELIDEFSSYEPPAGGRGIVLAFRCASPAGVDEAYEAVTAAGYGSKVEPFDAFWGQRYATVLDPDGNPVDLYAALG